LLEAQNATFFVAWDPVLVNKEKGNSLSSSFVSHCLLVKPRTKGTQKNLDHMRRGYRNYIAKRKLEFEKCTDKNKLPSK